jgi:hypothetical protein
MACSPEDVSPDDLIGASFLIFDNCVKSGMTPRLFEGQPYPGCMFRDLQEFEASRENSS